MRIIGPGGRKASVLKVISGTFVAQLISLALLPIISRLYSAHDFGALAFITSIALIVTTVSTLRLETAMMLPKRLSDVRALIALSFTSIVLWACLTGIGVSVAIRVQPELSSVTLLPFWAALTVVLASTFTVLNGLTLRKGGYGEVGKRAVAQALGTTVGQIALSLQPGGGLALVLGSLFGRSVGIAPLVRYTNEFFGRFNPVLFRSMLREYWRFPAVFAPSSMFNAFGAQAPVLFVASWFGVGFAGVLGMAERVLGVPMTLIGNSVGQVFDAEVAKGIREGRRDFTRLYLRVSAGLSLIAVPVGLGFFLFGEWLVPLALGERWELAGACVRIMSLTVALRLLAIPTGRVIALFQRSRGMLAIDASRALLVSSAAVLVGLSGASFLGALIYLYSALSMIYAITWIYGWHVVRAEVKRV